MRSNSLVCCFPYKERERVDLLKELLYMLSICLLPPSLPHPPNKLMVCFALTHLSLSSLSSALLLTPPACAACLRPPRRLGGPFGAANQCFVPDHSLGFRAARGISPGIALPSPAHLFCSDRIHLACCADSEPAPFVLLRLLTGVRALSLLERSGFRNWGSSACFRCPPRHRVPPPGSSSPVRRE